MEGDSFDYEVLQRAAERVRDVSGLVCEIGTRRGGSLKYIMDGLEGTRKHIVCIDPYGDIGYNGADNQMNVRYDYTNAMKHESLPQIYTYAASKNVNIVFFNLEDTEFMGRFHDGVPVYDVRLLMGDYLAKKIARETDASQIDVVMPIPDSSRPAAMQVAKLLNVPYREGFFKNRYVGRTFIMPGQAMRKKSVRQKLNAMSFEFKDKNVLIVDDSIVRGTTSYEIVQMARDAGAKKVIFASAAPPVCYPNVYGIDMPTRSELVAYGRTHAEITALIGADQLIYQDVEDLKRAVRDINPKIENFDASCFDGHYVTGDITESYLDALEAARNSPKAIADRQKAESSDLARSQLHLQLASQE